MTLVTANRLGPPAILALASIGSDPASAQQREFDVGVRGVVIVSEGEPSNDMTGFGLVGRWKFRDSWYLGVGFDSVTFDYETPYRVLGIDSTGSYRLAHAIRTDARRELRVLASSLVNKFCGSLCRTRSYWNNLSPERG